MIAMTEKLALTFGNFLGGFYVQETPEFEQWVLIARLIHFAALAFGGM